MSTRGTEGDKVNDIWSNALCVTDTDNQTVNFAGLAPDNPWKSQNLNLRMLKSQNDSLTLRHRKETPISYRAFPPKPSVNFGAQNFA